MMQRLGNKFLCKGDYQPTPLGLKFSLQPAYQPKIGAGLPYYSYLGTQEALFQGQLKGLSNMSLVLPKLMDWLDYLRFQKTPFVGWVVGHVWVPSSPALGHCGCFRSEPWCCAASSASCLRKAWGYSWSPKRVQRWGYSAP